MAAPNERSIFDDDYGDEDGGLERYARFIVDADEHPDCTYRYTEFGCKTCGLVPLEVIIERHTGSEERDFKGVVYAVCTQCKETWDIFGFTGADREPEATEQPVCFCGWKSFFVGMCERYEGADKEKGNPGFFDVGAIVGQCTRCFCHGVFVETD